MARSYTSTININTWKEHTCISCQALYAYNFKRKVARKARTADKATLAAQAAVQKTLLNDVDFQPCPACGIYQPDMIGQKRHRQHLLIFWLALVAFGIVLLLRTFYAVQSDAASWILVAIGAVAAVWTFATNWKNPNADPFANQQVAAARIVAGTVQLRSGKSGTAALEWVHPPRSPIQMLAGPILLAGVVFLAGAELARIVHGWPLNADAYPPVIGPGDQTRVYMTQKIDSIKGYWRGTPSATLTLPAPEKPVPLTAETNQNDWGNSISFKSDEGHSSATPWVELQLPDVPNPAGKTVSCNVTLDVEYPQLTSPGHFEPKTDSMSKQFTFHLGPSGAGARYNQLWWTCGLVGMALILCTDLLLLIAARNLKAAALPTRILNPAPAA